MKATTIKLALYASTAMFVYADNASAANNVLEPHETYKSRYIFVPGTQGSYGYWGKSSVTPEEAWSQDPKLHFQTGAISAIGSSIGSAIASAASSAAGAVASAVGAVVSQAGGIAGLAVKVVPFAAGLTKDLVFQQLAANNAASLSNAEEKAATARVIVQTEADKAIAQQQNETALALEKMKQETEKAKAEEETKRAQIEADKEKEIAKTNAG